jgi:hypothetical protein
MNCASCKHIGRCDGNPGDDCYEPVPRQVARFDWDMTLIHAYATIQQLRPGVRIMRGVVLPRGFVTLERARASRATA